MNHTPRPWVVGRESDNPCEAFVIESDSRTVCWTASSIGRAGGDDVITDEDRANARLISSAPDLLFALKFLRDPDRDGQWTCHCDEPRCDGAMCEMCVATVAIIKAEGGTHPWQ